jgi:hypothetical protein
MWAESPSNRARIPKERKSFVPCPRSPNGIWGPNQPPRYRRLIPRRKRGRCVKVAAHPIQYRDKKCKDVYLHSPMRCYGMDRKNFASYNNDIRFMKAFLFTRYHLYSNSVPILLSIILVYGIQVTTVTGTHI